MIRNGNETNPDWIDWIDVYSSLVFYAPRYDPTLESQAPLHSGNHCDVKVLRRRNRKRTVSTIGTRPDLFEGKVSNELTIDKNISTLALTSCFFKGSLFLFGFFKFPALKLCREGWICIDSNYISLQAMTRSSIYGLPEYV